jgi:Mlc titration factor MtfA (ptsG expression regulator)
MWRRLSERWRKSREDAALQRRAIADDLWKRTLVRYPFLRRHNDPAATELRRLASLFLDRKEFVATGGLRLGNDVVVAVAAQACLPVLKLGLEAYDSFVGIVLHPDQVLASRTMVDEDGVVHEYDDALSGETVHGGPVMLSWRDVRSAGARAGEGYNVVIHEFAHVLDMDRGLSRGLPDHLPMPTERSAWQDTWRQEFEQFAARVAEDDTTVLDPYGAESPEEFFAVTSEAFFVAPAMLAREHEALYRLLQGFYRQDPLNDTGGRPPRRPT